MRMVDLIAKKKRGERLENDEIAFFIKGCASGEIPDYQLSAMCMAICFSGMDSEETAAMTVEMASSGDMVDLSGISGVKADKHSTGGVGDKTTLVAAPIAASLGVTVAKMSGRALGHTGGTVDKLESIPGYRADISGDEFLRIVRTAGISVAGQSANLAPADKKLYALRDATATVDSIPLIASSIMSKKIAAGADIIVLDVKTGSGAFMRTYEGAKKLAEEMVEIGKRTGRLTAALLTDMDKPLGMSIGNSLEVIEAIETLNGGGPEDLAALSVEIAANMLFLAGKGGMDMCRQMSVKAIKDGSALKKLREMVDLHGGDISYIDNPEKFPKASVAREFKAPRDGWITRMDTEMIGLSSMLLGAGRKDKDSAVDYSAGIVLRRKTGDRIKKGENIASLCTNNGDMGEAEAVFARAVHIDDYEPKQEPLIIERIGGDDNTTLH